MGSASEVEYFLLLAKDTLTTLANLTTKLSLLTSSKLSACRSDC